MTKIGALLNIDPGQTKEKIDKSFETMKACGMSICRIVLDSKYGADVFDLYDQVFDLAESYGMNIVVTLRGDDAFCKESINRYAKKKCLHAWDVSELEGKESLNLENEGTEVITEGLSLLPGVDFSGFARRRYEIVTSVLCDVARSTAGDKGFWVTALQGGNNIMSGSKSFSPTPGEITQWLWTTFSSGAKGVFIQSVNSKKDGKGAGEMSLLNMQGGVTGRSEAVKDVISCLMGNAELLKDAKPVFAPVTMIYTKDSLKAEALLHRDDLSEDDYEVRQKGGSFKDAIAIYQVLMERGIRADFCEISEYPWEEDSKGKCVIFAGQLSVPTKYYPNLREFVKRGGKVIIEGLSFMYDENMNSVFSSDFPLKDVFGGYVEEYNCQPGQYRLRVDGKRYWVHLFDGIIHNYASGESLRILRNKYGRGHVTWIPSVIGMGALKAGHRSKLSRFFKRELRAIIEQLPIRFKRRYSGIALQLLETPSHYITVVTSSKRHRRRVAFRTEMKVEKRLFFNNVNDKQGKAKNRKVKVHAGQTVVALWKK